MVEKKKWVEKFINWLLHDKSCCGWVYGSKCVDGHPEHPRNRYWTQSQHTPTHSPATTQTQNSNQYLKFQPIKNNMVEKLIKWFLHD